MATETIAMTDSAAQIIASNTDRKKLVLHNTGNDVVYVGSDGSITSATAFPIYQGEKLDLSSYTGVVYGICASTETSNIEYLQEAL